MKQSGSLAERPRARREKTASLELAPGSSMALLSDARKLDLPSSSVDLVVTSPPYWQKRDYGFDGQIGQEASPERYVDGVRAALREWWRVLRSHGSVFLNIGDTYANRSLVGIPWMLESAARSDGWLVRNRIIWAKTGGMPSPARNRLANRHEYILHLTRSNNYYYDLQGYAEFTGSQATPGDVWQVELRRDISPHLAPFPPEIVERAVVLACPSEVCTVCGEPRRRVVERTTELDPSRPQARRAMEIAQRAGLTEAHIAAVQATGVSDAGKAREIQSGTGRNSVAVQRLAAEAKAVLGGYFREFTFAKKRTVGFRACDCGAPVGPGVVLDPFAGTGTTLWVATRLGRAAIGVDLDPKALIFRQGPAEQFELG